MWWNLSLKEKKTLWEREKMLVTSIFSVSYNVLQRLLSQEGQDQGLFDMGLTIYENNKLSEQSKLNSLQSYEF